MAQAFLLKTDVAIISSNASQKYIKNQATDTDDRKADTFSSALDKQVDKQAVQQPKKPDETDDKSVKSVDDAGTKTDASGEKVTKESSDDLVADSEKLDDTDQNKVAVISEASSTLPKEGGESETLSDDVLTIASNGEAKSDDASSVGHQTLLTSVGVAGETNKKVLETSKLALTTPENENLERKQHTQSLRSDILNALQKTTTSEGDKLASSVEQKIVASSTLIPIINKEGLSEKQQIMALANNVKLKGSLSTGTALERSTGVASALLTATTSQAIGSTAVSAQPALNLQPALQSEAWGRVLSSRVIWMAREGVQQASLKLNPANMGPVEVKLHMHNDQANISFIAQHAATRDALEQALPRLRESFQENGMELAHADVSQENFSQADEQDNNKTMNNGSTSERDNVDTDIETTDQDINIAGQDIALGLSVFA
tara:strand:- start:20931 stop:22229 length:1299 start_codon:yes stop_codon:yes gene_type:complete